MYKTVDEHLQELNEAFENNTPIDYYGQARRIIMLQISRDVATTIYSYSLDLGEKIIIRKTV